MSVRLRDLLDPFQQKSLAQAYPESDLDQPVSLVTSDSRQISPGSVFVAVQGVSQDGHRYFAQAAAQGAILLVGEQPAPEGIAAPHTAAAHAAPDAAYLAVKDSRHALARMAAKFQGDPSRGMKLVGVTGTSGKTTTTYLIESILEAAGYAVGVIGTVNFRFKAGGVETVVPSTHTTPGAPELQELLARMKRAGCTAVVMEVSSHALKQARASSIAFDGMVFTNLTPEHLDFHPDLEDYYASKKLLFTELADFARDCGKRPTLAANADDEWGRRLLDEVPGVSFALEPAHASEARVSGADLRVDLAGVHGRVSGASGDVQIDSPLIGRFNASNILAAVTVTAGLGIAPAAIGEGIRRLAGVPGRVERVPNSRGVHVIVDYAHKPDALDKVLRTLAEVKGPNRLITVFGCGGDRDRTKRPVMGRIAVELSDRVIITSDNPRTENPTAIIDEIVAGARSAKAARGGSFELQPDRARAIQAAIAAAKPGDLVLIAGKGHEDYQILADPAAPGGTRKVRFDDREVAAAASRK